MISITSGLDLLGIIEDPVEYLDAILNKLNSWAKKILISHENFLTSNMGCFKEPINSNSNLPRLFWTYRVFNCFLLKFSSVVEISRLIGRFTPYPAADPNGFIFIQVCVLDSKSALSRKDSAKAPNHKPQVEGMALCKWV